MSFFARSFLVLLLIGVSLTGQTSANELRTVPAGTLTPFWLKPQKNARPQIYKINSLLVQTHQVTNAEYIEFLKENPKWRKSSIAPLFAEETYLNQFNDDLTLKSEVDPQSPVTSVSWFAARTYCQKLGLRLPTIVEWEYIAAASEKKKNANSESEFLARILNWYGQPQSGSLPKVKGIYKNIYGLYDLHGLVWEWVEDFNSSLATGESREDTSLNRNMFCGAGSMNSGDKENYASFMRFAFRSSLKGSASIWNLGFRCVKDLKKGGSNE